MANVNDGSVVWSLNKINNAEQLNGLTAEQIKNNAINGKTVKLQGKSGSFTLTYTKQGTKPTFTIPLPSGYSRNQCSYVITEEYNSETWNEIVTSISTKLTGVNQTNGVVTADISSHQAQNVSITCRYMVTSAK